MYRQFVRRPGRPSISCANALQLRDSQGNAWLQGVVPFLTQGDALAHGAHERHIAKESVANEDVEKELSGLIEGRIMNDRRLPESSKLPLGSRRLIPSVSTSLPRSRPL